MMLSRLLLQRPCARVTARTTTAVLDNSSSSAHVKLAHAFATEARSNDDDASATPVHIPVLLHETIAAWAGANATDRTRYFVDGTTGFGGHSRALLEHCPNARLLCIDRDAEVLAIARANLRAFGDRVVFQQGSYVDIRAHLAAAGFPHQPRQDDDSISDNGVDGVLVDLGANSFHFDQPHRGFSWMHDGPLDMRFDQHSSGQTAADVLNTHSEVQLTKIFRDFGEEKLAKEFAKAIVRDRDESQFVFRTTQDLKVCIERIAHRWQRDAKASKATQPKAKTKTKATTSHPATRCFQALRIYVNEELQHVEDGVHALVDQLAPGGRLVTIAFHSLEDRPIKSLFRTLDAHGRNDDDDDDDNEEDYEEDDNVDKDALQHKRFRLMKRKATKPTADEIARNSRSRSARLRCLERTQ